MVVTEKKPRGARQIRTVDGGFADLPKGVSVQCVDSELAQLGGPEGTENDDSGHSPERKWSALPRRGGGR